jgi:predicted DNA-binding transcriptional regulator AlpA
LKIEVELPDYVVQAIAEKVVELLKPYLLNNHVSGQDELLTAEQASKLLQRSKGQIYQWVSNTKHGLSNFPYHKQGKQLRFSKIALMNWNNGQKNC